MEKEQLHVKTTIDQLNDVNLLKLAGAGAIAMNMAGIADDLERELKEAKEEIAEAIALCKKAASTDQPDTN